jgi:hypothetical protein
MGTSAVPAMPPVSSPGLGPGNTGTVGTSTIPGG